jgi:pimeloyl-ACP methyl ester carboxylesterase
MKNPPCGRQRLWRRAVACAIAAIAAPTAAAAAEPSPVSISPEIAAEYVRPHQAVDVGGRNLNLYCVGAGRRTVLLEAGGSDWSVTWALVQPALAGKARVCAYDRAGLGYSDPAPGYIPRTPVAIVEDMHAMVAAAGLQRPLVLVGHSLGGFNVKLYAALYPEDVAGLVLVDPSEDRSSERIRDMLNARFGPSLAARSELMDETFLAYILDRYRRCAELARQGPLDPASDAYRRCSDPPRPQLGEAIAAERRRLQALPAYQTAQASEILNSIYGSLGGEAVYQRLFRPGAFGDKPMLVLTHGRYDPADPMDAASQAGNIALAEQTARLSRRGRQRTIPDTAHNIQIEAPEAIVKAVEEVIEALDPPRPAR